MCAGAQCTLRGGAHHENVIEQDSAAAAIPAERPKLAPPVNWWKLDPAQRVETLQVVAEFTSELVSRYRLKATVVPPCWFLHEALVQELLALFQYRNQQQFVEAAPPGAPHEFHYQFQFAIARLRSWVKEAGCTPQEHFDQPIRQPWTDPESDSAKDFARALERHATSLHHYPDHKTIN